MLPDRYLAELASALEGLTALARQHDDVLSRSIPACPGWTLDQLFGHLGSIERWAAAVVRGGNYVDEPAPPATGAAAWFLDGSAAFLKTMTALDPQAPCWNFGPPPRTAGFWLRRQAHEHAIHLIDARQASGLAAPDFGADFMLDGVDEVLAMFTPRQLRLERMQQPQQAVSFHVPGAGNWIVGPGPAAASITAPLPDMYLGLWGRSGLEGAAIIEGDAALALRVLRGPLTP
ncbi:maleylpyruvate isomerase family mycothiol-dependent enzyme [Arthrobacter sp. 24S4-2]|uniref:maleylpyruvate isomerase family mycothiol-dependent enzyme n=1 Tax=Arthrobacter sp. 24S4-2 TaxID=2575374 RepID=UPI0010C7A1CA|nr:maleylpyruvate isomerase family mycothiol-dependent enzyme [Arthrobacter sp. 24S4-2]QCO98837.1 maleylpyruvate isomerase family mycothiol-dependent enzyme [Arthrobacter sp. 24S4-2]